MGGGGVGGWGGIPLRGVWQTIIYRRSTFGILVLGTLQLGSWPLGDPIPLIGSHHDEEVSLSLKTAFRNARFIPKVTGDTARTLRREAKHCKHTCMYMYM